MSLIEINNLTVEFQAQKTFFRVVDGVNLSLEAGKTLALVGESGSGKSVTGLSILGLIGFPGRITSGEVIFEGRDLLKLPGKELSEIRGNRIGMIFQEPMTSLNPVLSCGEQIAEVLIRHKKIPKPDAKKWAVGLLKDVGLPDPEKIYAAYPHELSGGMRQRIMIAMSLACTPSVLIADEPTTALDPTVQRQILQLLRELQKQYGMAILLITHDMGIVAEFADSVAVMYASRIVEESDVPALFKSARHPYSKGLLQSIPGERPGSRLIGIPGQIPDAANFPTGCFFHPRCGYAKNNCETLSPAMEQITESRRVACHFWKELAS